MSRRAALLLCAAGSALIGAGAYFLAPLCTGDPETRLLALPLALLAALGALLFIFGAGAGRPIGAGWLFAALALLALGLFARLALFPVQTRDYTYHLSDWLAQLRLLPGAEGLAANIGNYNLPYIYILFAIAKCLPVSLELYAIKLVSAAFDLVLAYAAMRLVTRAASSGGKPASSRALPAAAFFAAFLLPSAVVNGAMWGQCDSIFTSLALLGLYHGLCGNGRRAFAFFALSFAVKLQAIFLLPMLPVLLLAGRIRLRDCWAFFAALLATLLPALLAGRGLADCLSIYLNQPGTYTELSLYAPNAYVFCAGGLTTHRGMTLAGIFVSGALVLLLLLYLYLRRKTLSDIALLCAALLFALVMPYFLPTMHERYFFVADALACALLFARPGRFAFAPLICLSSFFSHLIYLFAETQAVPLWALSLAMLAALLLTARALFAEAETPPRV